MNVLNNKKNLRSLRRKIRLKHETFVFVKSIFTFIFCSFVLFLSFCFFPPCFSSVCHLHFSYPQLSFFPLMTSFWVKWRALKNVSKFLLGREKMNNQVQAPVFSKGKKRYLLFYLSESFNFRCFLLP